MKRLDIFQVYFSTSMCARWITLRHGLRSAACCRSQFRNCCGEISGIDARYMIADGANSETAEGHCSLPGHVIPRLLCALNSQLPLESSEQSPRKKRRMAVGHEKVVRVFE
jgi:hypothetical protein